MSTKWALINTTTLRGGRKVLPGEIVDDNPSGPQAKDYADLLSANAELWPIANAIIASAQLRASRARTQRAVNELELESIMRAGASMALRAAASAPAAPSLAAVTAIEASGFLFGAQVYTSAPLWSRYVFNPASTIAADGREVLNATVGGAIAATGRWHLDTSYVDPINVAITNWYVNQTTGHDDTGDGTQTRPVASVDEVFRRRGYKTSLSLLVVNVVGASYVGDIVVDLQAATGTTTYLRFGQNQVAVGTLSSIAYPARTLGGDATIIDSNDIADWTPHIGRQIVFAGGAVADIVGAPSAHQARITLPSTYDTAGGTASYGLTTYPSLQIPGNATFTVCDRTRHTGTLRLSCASQTSVAALEAGVLVAQYPDSDLLEPGNNVVVVGQRLHGLFVGPDVSCDACYVLGGSVVDDGIGISNRASYVFAQTTYFTSSVIVGPGKLHLDDDAILDGVTPSVDAGGMIKLEDNLCVLNCDSPLSTGDGMVECPGANIYGFGITTGVIRVGQLGKLSAHNVRVNATGAPAVVFDSASSSVYRGDAAPPPTTAITAPTVLAASNISVDLDTSTGAFAQGTPQHLPVAPYDNYEITFLVFGANPAWWIAPAGATAQNPDNPSAAPTALAVSCSAVGSTVTFRWVAARNTYRVV